MDAIIVTIGDELLIGQVVDTNSAWIAAHLNEIGIKVSARITVGDERHQMKDALTDAMRKSQLVITTGGLGPTRDDITKQVLADIFECGMREDEQTVVRIADMLAKRGVSFNELNRSQALVPEKCSLLVNENGTAPGMWFEKEGRLLISLPGVPFEMEELMLRSVLPQLTEKFNESAIVHRTMITQGIAESMLAEKISHWEDALPDWLSLAYLPGPSGVRLRLSAYGVPLLQAEKSIGNYFKTLEKLLGKDFIGYGQQTIQQRVAEKLTDRGLTLAVAESCTGGNLSFSFTSMQGASRYFKGGVIAYDNQVKHSLLGVKIETLDIYGAVSQQTVIEMADGIIEVCGSDCAIATSGIAGPTGGTEKKPVGTVWIAAKVGGKTLAKQYSFGKLRQPNIERATAAALRLVMDLLEEPQ